MKTLYRRSHIFVCLLFCLMLSASAKAERLQGTWVQHPAIAFQSGSKEGIVDRIIDGNRYVYFSVRGTTFNRSNTQTFTTRYNLDPIQLFRYDKNEEWSDENIHALSHDEATGGQIPATMAYDPRLGVMTVVYDNLSVDLYHDDGRFISTSALSQTPSTGKQLRAYSITYDREKPLIYVALSTGYAVIDTETGDLEKIQKFDKDITWAGRFGDRMVLFGTDNVTPKSYSSTAYIVDSDNTPYTLSGHELKLQESQEGVTDGELNVIDLQGLMPLGENTFAAFGASTSETGYDLVAVTLGKDSNLATKIVSGGTFDNGSSPDFRHLFKSDGRYSAMTDGYMISDSSNLYLLKSGTDLESGGSDAADSFKKGALTTIGKSALASTERPAKVSTVDGKTVWFPTYDTSTSSILEKGFYTRSLNPTDGTWGGKSSVCHPNAPYSMAATYMDWNPVYGMTLRGPGTYFGTGTGTGDVDYIFTYKDGKWTDRSPLANAIKYRNLSAQRYAIHDPVNPAWIWSELTSTGLVRLDMENPDNVFVLGGVYHASWETSMPGYFAYFPSQPIYPSLINFSNVVFDKDENMWFTHDFLFDFDEDYQYYTDAYVPFYYYTREERQKMANIGGDKSQFIEPHLVKVPHKHTDRYDHLLALKSPGNENLIVHVVGTYTSYWRSCLVFDHNGTPGDTSDDRYAFVENTRDENADMMNHSQEFDIYEDIKTGEVWLFTDYGVLIFDPQKLLDGDDTIRRYHIEKKEGAAVDEYPFDQITVKKIVDDGLGRKWVASLNGLYCLSADGKEILGHYTEANSPLPSNELFTVGVDMSTGAVFAGTAKGLVEFQPEDTYAGMTVNETSIAMSPQYVGPDYNGHVTITGVSNALRYEVTDSEGYTIKNLGTPSGGELQWDTTDDSGKRVDAGRYYIHQSGERNETNAITINR